MPARPGRQRRTHPSRWLGPSGAGGALRVTGLEERYGRRNLSESRDNAMERLGLKRLPCFGLSRNRREIKIGDFLENLSTLWRLVQEATLLAPRAAA